MDEAVRDAGALQPFANVTGIFDRTPNLHQPRVSGVDDSESECGLDTGVQFDWIVNNDAGGASLDEQLQPLLKLARESADRH